MNTIKILLLIIAFYLSFSCAKAAQIVYPKTNNVTINSDVTFFIGNENPDNELYINDEKVELHKSGGFYHVVNLKQGINTFIIKNGKEEPLKYTITRAAQTPAKYSEQKYKAFSSPILYITKKDNAPLRNAPNDSGTSRLQDFSSGIPLEAIGESGKFYKIQLAQDDYAWIDKNYLTPAKDNDNSPARILSYDFEESETCIKHNIKLNKKVPYVISEKRTFDLINSKYEPNAQGLDVTLYNVENYAENKFDIQMNTAQNLFGYKTYFDNDTTFRVEVNKIPKTQQNSLKGIKITLDPGHGGDEYGAIGCLGDKEKDINLAIALKAKNILEKYGATVYITRSDDSYTDLYDRVKFSQNTNSDIFISIHANALPDSLAKTYRSGTSTYYFYPQSAQLARIMLETLTKELGTKNDKVHQESFAVIRNHESIAVLLEIAYMINPEDSANLRNPEFQNKAATAILHGLERYINELNK